MRYLFILAFIICSTAQAYCKSSLDTVKIYFDLGVSEISPLGKQKIDSLIYFEKIRAGKKIGILGYTDYLGDDAHNMILSESRAKNIQAYLLSMGIKEEDIQLVIGNGEVRRPDTTNRLGYATDRRVDLILGGIKILPKKPTPPIAKSIDLSTVKKNEAIRLNNILFYPGSHKVTVESAPELNTLYHVMKENPTLKIRIEGHICCLVKSNTDGYDYDSEDFKLSENRAKEIYSYLLNRKIEAGRLEYKGFGKSKPLVDPEKDEKDENLNRRVEIRILEK